MTTPLDNQELDKKIDDYLQDFADWIMGHSEEELAGIDLRKIKRESRYKLDNIILSEAHRIGNLAIGEDEDDRYYANLSGEIVQDYEDACDAETRNELRKEQRQKLSTLTGVKEE